jgi:hypothetical protein
MKKNLIKFKFSEKYIKNANSKSSYFFSSFNGRCINSGSVIFSKIKVAKYIQTPAATWWQKLAADLSKLKQLLYNELYLSEQNAKNEMPSIATLAMLALFPRAVQQQFDTILMMSQGPSSSGKILMIVLAKLVFY